ncbi:MAG: hypothetical protein ACI9X4_002734 [Glaciecola sp.]|jgi:hypothetical protein
MTFSATFLLGLCLLSPLPDITSPGFKKVSHQVAIENPKDFDGWQVVVATLLGPSHITVAEPGVPFSYSSKYGTRIYALPSGTEVPTSPEGIRVSRVAFEGFLQASPPVSSPSQVSVLSPVTSVLTTIRIVDISAAGIQLKAVRTQEFNSSKKPISWFRIWALPIAAVVCGAAGLIALRKRRLKRRLKRASA